MANDDSLVYASKGKMAAGKYNEVCWSMNLTDLQRVVAPQAMTPSNSASLRSMGVNGHAYDNNKITAKGTSIHGNLGAPGGQVQGQHQHLYKDNTIDVDHCLQGDIHDVEMLKFLMRGHG